MIKKLKKLSKIAILTFGISFLFWSCENDSEQIETVEQKIDFTVKPEIKTFTLSELESDNTFSNLKNSFDILQSNTLYASRNATSSSVRIVDTLSITIDESSIKQIIYDNYVSYTMLMIERDDTSGNVSNLVIQEHNGNERIFTVRYTNIESDNTSASRNSNEPSNTVQMFSGVRSYTDFWEDDEGNGGSGTDNCEQYDTVCNTVNVWIPVSCGCGHSGDDPCSGCYGSYAGWTLGTENECEDICVDYGGNYNPNSGNPNTGVGSISDNNTPTEVATTLVNNDGTSAIPAAIINALGGESQLTSVQMNWINDLNNEEEVQMLFNYISQNGMTSSNTNFITDVINALVTSNNTEPTIDNYPGKNDGLPFEWWNDEDFILNSGNFDIDDEQPNAKEIAVFALFPAQALLHIENSTTALDKAQELVANGTLTGIGDGKADAFRHAFWNALGTAEFGSEVMKIFADAHEWGESGLSVTMDFYNNHKGRVIGDNFNFSTSEATISAAILQAVFNGTLKYINSSGVLVPTNL